MNLSRRTLLRASAAGLAAAPFVVGRAVHATADAVRAFVTDYQTNIAANTTADTNAAVRILSGMQRVWQTGTAWNTGTVLDPATLHASMRYVTEVTRHRTAEQAARAFIQDRQHQSYAVIAGLGPLAPIYKSGALAVTSITSAPEGTPATTIDDAVPADAAPGSALGAGSPTSALGEVVTLVNTVRGSFSSGNPSKAAYLYPRPWRMTAESRVVDTGTVDEFGFPVYDSPVAVVPQLLRQRSATPATDGGFPSGHTNAFHLAALAFAYAIPQRFQELVTAAFDLAETRIVAGMHSPVDVIGGRILATALAAAILNDPANATLKNQARLQAAAFLPLSMPQGEDAYADRRANERIVTPKLTYGLPRGRSTELMTVPQGAEVLLETRQPYLTAAQRREVLRTTALPAGYPLLDGPEHWGRLNLFAAADGYGAFDGDVAVSLDTADAWRNDITGRGRLLKNGTGSLTLAGDNAYRGGTTVAAGTLVAAAPTALGHGDVTLTRGTLRTTGTLRLRGAYTQRGGVLAAAGPVQVDGDATLGGTLVVTGEPGREITVLRARRIQGGFAEVQAANPALRAAVTYTRTTVTVRLGRR